MWRFWRSTKHLITLAIIFAFACGFLAVVQPVSAANGRQAQPVAPGGEVIQRIEGHCAPGVPQPAKTWYLAEGSSAWGFECWLLIQNPNPQVANCHITYMSPGGSIITADKQVGAVSRQSFNIANDIGQNDASIKVESDVPVIPERAMYRHERREGDDSIGTTSPSKDYYLAEGTTNWGFTTFILVQNPGETAATVTLTYMTDGGPQPQASFNMVPHSRTTIRANDQISADFSTQVHSTVPIIAERSMFWGEDTALGEACHDSIGVSAPAKTWYLAEGSTGGGFETWIMVQNPEKSIVNAQVSYMTESGPVAGPTLTLGPYSRKTVNVADTLPNNWSVSTMITANGPVIAERSVYWNNRNGGHHSTGVSAPANQWYLAEGCTANGFETWVLVQNPGDQSSAVAVTYMTDRGEQAGPTIELPAHSRKTINVADTVPNTWSVSTKVMVTSGASVIAERSVYWSKEISPPTPTPPAPVEQFNSGDYPTTTGLANIYWVTDPMNEIYTTQNRYPVSISLAGPWDFTQGPEEGTRTQEYIPGASVPESTRFPGANVVRRDNDGLMNAVGFFKWDSSAANWMGWSYQNNYMPTAQFMTADPPDLAFRFPFKVGDSWGSQCNMAVSGNVDATGTYTDNCRVVSLNSIRVPAGDFDKCYLILDHTQESYSDGTNDSRVSYTWVVPGVGSVAGITSANGEINDVFTQATHIARLKEIHNPGSGKSASVPLEGSAPSMVKILWPHKVTNASVVRPTIP